jgi:hypothetical protein
VLFLLRVLLRNYAAALIGTTLFVIATTLGGENILFEAPAAVAAGIVIVACLMRSGLLGAAVMFAVNNTLLALPVAARNESPYTATSIIVLVLLIIATLAAFRAALGGRLALGRRFAEELGLSAASCERSTRALDSFVPVGAPSSGRGISPRAP